MPKKTSGKSWKWQEAKSSRNSAPNSSKKFRSASSSEESVPSAGIDREKALMAFASTRVDVLPGLWSAFYVAIGLPFEDPLLSQMINRRVFDDFLIKRQSVSIDSPAVPSVAMSVDEENAVRYAAGFVPFRLIKKFSKLAPNDKHSRFVQCLKSMSAHINHALSRASFTYSH